MKRRQFIKRAAAGGLALAAEKKLRGNVPPETTSRSPLPVIFSSTSKSPHSGRDITSIGRYSLSELRDYFHKELVEDTIPYWEKYGVDKEYGGFLIARKDDGTYPTTDKDLYSQGRILWVFSYLYNHFGKNPRHLEAARQGKEALVKHCRVERGHWGTLFTRDWKLKKGFFDIYADIYMVLGLAEYFKASGDEDALRLAVETSYLVNETILAPHYQGQGHGPFYEPGIKRLGTWTHFLFPLTLLLSYAPDEGLERIARMCVRNIIERHWNRQKGYAYEYLNDKYEPYSNDYLSDYRGPHDYTHYISGWHSIQAAWKVMFEALRVGVDEMFRDGYELGLQTLKGHIEEKEDCRLMEFENEEMWRRRQGNDLKPYYALYDVFVFCLLALEHRPSAEAAVWFDKTFSCAMSKPEKFKQGSLTLHEPRAIMFCLQILNRMIDRQKARSF